MIRLFFFFVEVIRRLLLSNHLSSYYSIIAHYIYASSMLRSRATAQSSAGKEVPTWKTIILN